MPKKVVTETKVLDDLDGSVLPEDTAPQTISFDGKKYEVYLSSKSSSRLMDFLTGTTPLLSRTNVTRTTGSKRGGSSVDNHGFDAKEVRAWAIGNKVKSDNGKPVGTSGRFSQSVYDAYRDAQTK